jgi:ribosome biogenesis GTPase / thiamine phosphate phosphatase
MNSIFRISFESRENYRVVDEHGGVFSARLSGSLRSRSELWPAVGDWVRGQAQQGAWVLIEEVLPRKTVLQRKASGRLGVQVLAANVDTLFIVTSANQDLNLNRLDRYVALAVNGGVQPVIVINKIELVEDPHSILDSVAKRFGSFDILGTSAHEGWNLDALESYALPGKTLAFVGSSGVGKSSLTNKLLGQAVMATQEISREDDRGRHTTTHRELHVAANGVVIIDTPGLRQVGLGDVDVGAAFMDIEDLGLKCKFSDCAHGTEPGCAIQIALESGALDEERWRSYLKLEKEVAFEKRKANKALQSEQKKQWAKIHRQAKARAALKGR